MLKTFFTFFINKKVGRFYSILDNNIHLVQVWKIGLIVIEVLEIHNKVHSLTTNYRYILVIILSFQVFLHILSTTSFIQRFLTFFIYSVKNVFGLNVFNIYERNNAKT